MKTKSLILLVALISIATMTYSTNERPGTNFTVKITLQAALHNPGLVLAMHQQIDRGAIYKNAEQHIYTFAVRYRGVRYLITGTYEQWKEFFSVLPDDPTPET